jgi:hypothetical protein
MNAKKNTRLAQGQKKMLKDNSAEKCSAEIHTGVARSGKRRKTTETRVVRIQQPNNNKGKGRK